MKKILFLMLFIFIGINFAYAETIDITPPEIHNIHLYKNKFNAGDEIKFKIDASDDVIGIVDIIFEFADINNYENSISIPMKGEFINGEKNYTGIIPQNVRNGEYYVRRVHISDEVRNNNCYAIDGLPFVYEDCVIKDFQISNIVIEADETMQSTPKLESLTYNKNNFSTGGTLIVTAKITPGAEIDSVRIMFGTKQYYLTKIDEYTYSTEILITNSGDMKFECFTIEDKNKNYIHYIYESIYNNLPDNYGFDYFADNTYDITVTGDSLYKTPVLKNITFSKSTLKVPGFINVYLDIESENLDDLDIQLGVHQKDCISNCGAANTASLYKEDGKYYFKLIFDQYQPAGTYYIHHVRIIDSYNNEVVYGEKVADNIESLPMGYYSFEIVNDTNADITSSNTALDIINKIENAAEGSVISIDTSKDSKIKQDIFKAIKGKNKTISLESNGIRWIFNGLDINNSKTIDIETEIVMAKDYASESWNPSDNALIIKFKENGILPGKVLIRVKADWAFQNYLGDDVLNVYYINKKNFDLISNSVSVTSDEYYEFYIDHNSTYVLSNKKIDSDLIANDYTEKLNNNTPDKDNTNTQDKNNTNTSDKNNTNTPDKDNTNTSDKNNTDTPDKNNTNTSDKDNIDTSNKDNTDTSDKTNNESNSETIDSENKEQNSNDTNKNNFGIYLSIGIILLFVSSITCILLKKIKKR